MEQKLYMLVTRNNIGVWEDKLRVFADIEFCKRILETMFAANNKAVLGEIIEGNKDYLGDSRVKPLHRFKIEDGKLMEV